MTEALVPYTSGILGLIALVIIILILGPVVSAKKAGAKVKPGSEPEGSYDDPIYRWHRAHLNAVEHLPVFAIPALLAMSIGVSATWVNGLIWGSVALRLVFTFVYVQNIGKPTQSVRTFTFVAGWVLTVILVILIIAQAM